MSTTETTAPAVPARRGRWIDHWEPEDPGFREKTGKRVANRNLWFSIFGEHIGFSMWTVWSVLVLFMGKAYAIDPAGKFLLVSLPSLIGALIRIPYTMGPAQFGGRNWTIVSALAMLIPTVLAMVVMYPGSSFTTFVIVAASVAWAVATSLRRCPTSIPFTRKAARAGRSDSTPVEATSDWPRYNSSACW